MTLCGFAVPDPDALRGLLAAAAFPFCIGGAFAAKPAVQLLTVESQLSVLIPREFVVMSTTWLPSFPSAVLGAMLLAAIMLGLRMIEDE